jgi:PGF-CTERM protein
MKSITKMMLVAMVLVAALVVAPAAARAINDTGANVYVGEEDLNFTGAFDGTARLVHYSGAVGEATDKIFTVNSEGNITEITAGPTGAYYALDSANVRIANVNVQVPSATLDARLNASKADSVAGRSVTRNTELVFRLANNLDAALNYGMNIEVTLPGGGVVTQVGPAESPVVLRDISVNGTTAVTAPFTLTSAGTYVAQAKWPRSTDFFGKGYDSNTVTFEVATKALAITSNKDNVVRGSSFTVTLTGESRDLYRVWITPSSVTSPWMPDGQTVFNGTYDARDMEVRTNAGGTASVQFNSNTSTEARTYTVHTEKVSDTTINDEVRVRVEEGAVTVTASGAGTYYLGEEITLSGTCTDGETVYLYMTGPNLNSNGVNLDNLGSVTDQNVGTFTDVDVESDDTWSHKWNTGNLGGSLDAGGYTIYAAAEPQGRNNLTNVKYATTSIQLRSGFITATTTGATVAKGDDLTITGTAQGNPDDVNIWVFGKNFYGDANNRVLSVITATVESDGSFEDDSLDTSNLASGQYFVVVQHPMTGGFGVQQGVAPGQNTDSIYRLGANPAAGTTEFVANLVGLQASEAANALISALDSPYVDDTYVKLTFVIEEAQIFIDAIGDKAAGSTFTITGTTNLAVGDTLNVEVTSAAFQPTTKTEASGFASVAGTTTVQQGDGANTWSLEVNGASFKPDQYIVRVESIETDTTATTTFNVVEAVPTTQATPTTTGTAVTTPTTTATTAATPTQSPGFGALLALAGLGAVAFLVLRRD